MFRFILIFGMALLSLGPPAIAKDKPKPPAISACYGKICLAKLRWGRPSMFDDTRSPYIEGTLVNGSNTPLRGAAVRFALQRGESGKELMDTALAVYSDVIPPGGRWLFRAPFEHMINGRIVGRTESVSLETTIMRRQGAEDIAPTLHFDPVFNPDDRGAIKRWEKIHGKRQR